MNGTLTTDWRKDTLLFAKPHERLCLIARLLAEQPQRRLLDVGCSTGILGSLLPPDFDYHGCDMADYAAAVLGPERFRTVDLNGEGLSALSDWEIDAISMSGVLEYMHDPGRILRQARERVAAGSLLVASLLNFQSGRWSKVGRCHPTTVYKPSLEEFRELLSRCGWQVTRQVPFLPAQKWRRKWRLLLARWLGVDHWWTRRTCWQFILVATAV